MSLQLPVEHLGGERAHQEGEDRQQMVDGLHRVVVQQRHAQQDAVACHGGGEDVPMVQVDEGVQRAAGAGQQDCGGQAPGRTLFDLSLRSGHGTLDSLRRFDAG
jgi:hypothetical protein